MFPGSVRDAGERCWRASRTVSSWPSLAVQVALQTNAMMVSFGLWSLWTVVGFVEGGLEGQLRGLPWRFLRPRYVDRPTAASRAMPLKTEEAQPLAPLRVSPLTEMETKIAPTR